MTEQHTALADTTVTAEKTAVAMGSGDLPVFATPAMVALMEEAAARCAQSFLAEGETTVGVKISTSHIKASPLGAAITAKATLQEQAGKSFLFLVEAFEGDVLIGSGEHTRVVVNGERFLAKLQKPAQ